MSKTIYVSEGQVSYVGGTITDTTGKDISGDTITVALGTYSIPPAKADATPPDSDAQGATTAERVVKKLIGDGATIGDGQYLWAWVTDSPEIEPIRLDGPIDIK